MNHGELGKLSLGIDHNLIGGLEYIALRSNRDNKHCASSSPGQIVSRLPLSRVNSHHGATFLVTSMLVTDVGEQMCW